MDDDDQVFIQVRSFVRELAGDAVEVTRATSLEKDLWLYGDEAEKFLLGFSEEFCVDLKGFDFCRYFSPEPFFFNLKDKLLRIMGVRQRKEELTVNDLCNAAKMGSFAGL